MGQICGHFYNPRTVMVMNFYSCLFKHWYQIDQHQLTLPPALEILKFHKHITCRITPGNTSTDNGQELTIHEENEVVHIRTHFISRSYTVKRGPITETNYNAEPQITVLANV